MYRALDSYAAVRFRRWLRFTHKTRRSKGGSYPLPHLYEIFGLVRLTRLGRDAPDTAAAVMIAAVVPVVVLVLRPKRTDEHDPADLRSMLDQPSASNTTSAGEAVMFRLTPVLRNPAFITTSIPFALALTAQVGFLTHQVAFLSPLIGTLAAGWAVGLTTFGAVLGRIAAGFVVDRFNRRVVASLNFITQAFGISILSVTTKTTVLYLGCLLFGLGVGNATSLPGLIVQDEFPKQHFARIISLVVAINQFSFAFGPILLAHSRALTGNYTSALLVCLAMEILAAEIVVLPPALIRRRVVAEGRLTF
jgi:predicted MFS family arabinose efflux permease